MKFKDIVRETPQRTLFYPESINGVVVDKCCHIIILSLEYLQIRHFPTKNKN